jgi:anti-sigma factor RsiW
MTHLGQRLSALIDGELDCAEVDRVLGHLARCDWCREEAAALRALKRRMNALGEAAAGAGITGLSGLTGRLMSLTSVPAGGMWPHPARDPDANTGDPEDASEGMGWLASRASRYFLSASVAVFLAGVGTAAFIAGGDPHVPAPTPDVTPSVDVFYLLQLPHDNFRGITYGLQGLRGQSTVPASSKNHLRPRP